VSGSAGGLCVRCLMDQRVHLLDRPRVLDLAEVGCALARCGVLLLIPEVTVHPVGQPCPTCLGGLLSSPVEEAERASGDGGPRRGADQHGAGSRAGLPAIPLVCGSPRLAGGDAGALGGDDDVRDDQVLPVAARFRDHPRGSLVCPACAGADDGGPIPGWPPVEMPTLIPGGQPVPSPARRCPTGPVPVPPPRFSHPGRHSGTQVVVAGGAPGPHREPEVTRPRWGSCPADGQLHLLDPTAVREATVVGWAKADCGRLIFAVNLTLRSGSVGLCVGCVAAGSTP
jgi:hypothetical protein